MNEEKADRLLDLVGDIRALARLALRSELRELRAEVFGGDQSQIEAYRLFNTGASYREIGDSVSVSHTTVGRWVEAWRSAGLVHPSEKRCLVTPEMLEID